MKLFAALLLLGFYPLCTTASNQISNPRLAELADGTQMVFDLSASVEYRSFRLDDPPRFVVDLANTRLKFSPQEINLRSVDVQSIRTGIRHGVDLRIVVDLLNSFRSQAYLLDNPTGEGEQLVIDIFRDQKPHSEERSPQPHRLAHVERTRQGVAQFVVAIDPGHGGKDPGATGSRGTQEKKVVMRIARHLMRLLDKEPGMRGILTRNNDTYLHLYERIRIARNHQADLFVSLHADAFTNRKAHGSSVFILSTKGASSAAARWLAKKENEADLIGGGRLKVQDESLQPVVFDIYHDAVLAESMRLAEHILGRLEELGPVHSEHVERAGFAVLKAPDIPSVLVETAFISNPEEEAKLNSEAYQKQIAEAILAGIRIYLESKPPKYMIAEGDALAPPEQRQTSTAQPPATARTQQVVAKSTPKPITVQRRPASKAPAPVAPPIPPSVDLVAVSQPLTAKPVKKSPSDRITQRVHIIRRGESLRDIAKYYQIDVSQLRSMNGLSSNQLRMPAGTFLMIPMGDS